MLRNILAEEQERIAQNIQAFNELLSTEPVKSHAINALVKAGVIERSGKWIVDGQFRKWDGGDRVHSLSLSLTRFGILIVVFGNGNQINCSAKLAGINPEVLTAPEVHLR